MSMCGALSTGMLKHRMSIYLYSLESEGFVWVRSHSQHFVLLSHRPGPPVPELHLSEDFVLSTASRLRVHLNHYLDVVQDIAVGKDFKLFIKVLFPLSRQCVPK